MKYFFYALASLFLLSCASHKVHYSKEVKNWKSEFQLPTKTPQYILYAIADAGYLPSGATSPALTSLKKMIDAETNPSGVVIIGDNIYPAGMPKKGSPKREQAEKNLNPQIEVFSDYKGDMFITPGNHDWRQKDHQAGVVRQEKYYEKKLGKDRYFPDNGCSGPETFELSDDVVLIIIDSEWYLQNWDDQYDFNEDCPYQTREDFTYELADQIKKYGKDKRVIIGMHHPIFTEGSHGGKFGVVNYIMPLAIKNPKLKIPLPGLGLLYPIFRKNVGERQDINGALYKELRQKILTATDAFDNVIFISGHEHNMQYILREEHHHVVAGSGCKSTPVGMGDGSEFAWSDLGFARISVYENGESYIEYFACGSGEANLAYAKKLTEELTTYDPIEQIFTSPSKPFVEVPIMDDESERGGMVNFLLGKQYSALYNKPIRAKVTNLSIKQGGLKAVKRGGGFQTNSLRLSDSKDRHWVMRAMRKDPTRLLPDEFVGTVAIEAVEHFLTTAHPLAAYTLPPMTASLGMLHTKPELVYIPKQQALGEFNEDHGDKLYLFEDRPDDNRSDRDNFGNSENIISTLDLVREMKENSKHQPNQPEVIKARLFDMIIGDWDRHDDQWRWAEFEGKDNFSSYTPIPRDRDQAFSIFEGALIGFARIFTPAIAKFQTFDHKIKNVEYFNFNARYFDRSFMNQLTWADWEEQINYIQSNLTDEVIHKGMLKMQADFYSLHGADLESKIRSRRDGLPKYARKYYESLAKIVTVHASKKDDLIQVERTSNATKVMISDIDKSGDIKYTYYERTFLDSETKEVRIYGLDGDDRFETEGHGSSVMVRLIGGTDNDEYDNDGQGARVHVYDYPENSEIDDKNGMKVHLTDDYSYNTYNRKEFKYNHSFLLPLLSFNPDHGFLLGAIFNGKLHGFNKDPYKASHSLKGLYSFETEGFQVEYAGHFIDAIGKWNLRAGAKYQDKFFSNNFFGIGNNTSNQEEEPFNFDDDYNRVRNSVIQGNLFLEKDITKGTAYYLGPKIAIHEVENTSNRFVEAYFDENNIVFESLTYAGAEAGFTFEGIDNKANPKQGATFELRGDYLTSLGDEEISKTSITVDMGVYSPLGSKEKIVWAHKFGAGFTFSDKALFYHQQNIGGRTGLRGYRNERYTGKSMAYYNTDLRVELFDFNSYFAPSTVGIYGGFDIGRVWLKDDPSAGSNRWHTDFGLGLWINPFNMAVIKVSYFTSGKEQGRLLIGVGFDF